MRRTSRQAATALACQRWVQRRVAVLRNTKWHLTLHGSKGSTQGYEKKASTAASLFIPEPTAIHLDICSRDVNLSVDDLSRESSVEPGSEFSLVRRVARPIPV